MATKDNVQGVVLALFGASAGGHLAGLTASATANGLTAVAGDLASSAGFILGKDLSTAAAFRDNMLTGLGISSTNSAYAAAAAWADGELAKAGANRGEIVATAVNFLAGLTDSTSPFFAAATAYRTTVTAAVAWSEGAGATVFGVAALQAQQGNTTEVVGSTFTLTATDKEVVSGTTGNDTFNASTDTLNANDEIKGGEGNDVLNFTVKKADTTSTADVSGVETVNVAIKSFATVTDLDMTNFDNVTKMNISSSAGYADTITVTEAGDADYAFTGLKKVTLSNYDAGFLDVGTTKEIVLTTGNEVNGKVINDLDLTATVNADVNLDIAAGKVVTLNASSAVNTGDWKITGAGTIKAESLDVVGAKFDAPQATLQLTTTSASFDMSDINVATLSNASGASVTVVNAEGAKISLDKDSSDLVADTSDKGGSFAITVNKNTSEIVLGNTTDHTSEFDHVSIQVNASATTKVLDKLTVAGGDVAMNISGAKFELKNLAEDTGTSTTLNVTGDQALTVTTSSLTSFNGADYTGAITFVATTVDGGSIVTGSGADKITLPVDKSVDLYTGAGADVVDGNAYVGSNGSTTGVYVNLGEGDDTYETTAAVTGLGGTVIIDGGDGVDTVDLSDGIFDSGAFNKVVFANVETLKIGAGTNVLAPATLSGLQGLTIMGGSASTDEISITTAATTTTLDLSGVTYDSTVDTSTIDLQLNETTKAFSATLTNLADTVTGPASNTKTFAINLGAGNDEITLKNSAGVLTLGAGKDNVILAAGVTTSAVGDLVSIADFNIADDKITKVAAVKGTDKVVDVKSADAAATATSISATSYKGVITLAGAHAAKIDTLAEWISVVKLVSGADVAADATYAFEFNGNTYLTETKTNGTAEEVTIELTGVTGITAIGASASAHTIVLA